jgi:signal transduction histidine kinase
MNCKQIKENLMQQRENKLFFCQTIQETVALHFLLPIRTLSLSSLEQVFDYCKKESFLGLDYSNRTTFISGLRDILEDIPSFLHDGGLSPDPFLKILGEVKKPQIRYLRNQVYFTKSSFNPFFMAALDEYNTVKVLKMVFYLNLIFDYGKWTENVLYDVKFFNFSYRFFYKGENLYLIGPVMAEELFLDDRKRLSFIKNIKHYFSLNLHTYELLNMLNQRNVMNETLFTSVAQEIKKVLFITQNQYIEKRYKKHTLRELATHFIARIKNRKVTKIEGAIHKNVTFHKVLSRIRNNQILRDLEALEWFNDLIFQNLSFETSGDVTQDTVLKYLEKKLQAQGYVLCRFDHYSEQLSLMEVSPLLSHSFRKSVLQTLEHLNKEKEMLYKSFTYEVIQDYTEHKNPIKLVEDLKSTNHPFCKDTGVESVLSIPLVFDKRVFAVLHFIGFQKFRFDEIDKRFLLKLSSALSKRYIENNLNYCIDRTVSLLEGLNKKIDHRYLKQKSDEVCENIAKAFACDGAIIWFNKKEVFQTPKEVNELSILSQINFLDDEEIEQQQLYTIGSEEEDSLITQSAHKKDVIVIYDIATECSERKDDTDYLFMKYKREFVKKGISSIMFIAIKNYEGKLTGAVMVFDAANRKYSQLSKRMLKRISVYIGSILNTVTYAKYRDQRLDESVLHESSQYLNIIKGRALDLERRVQNFALPDSYDKHRLFLNIEDIKDFTEFMRNYLFAIFKNGKSESLPKYDELLSQSIQKVRQNVTYTSLRKSVNQVLAVHSSKMHLMRKMGYKNLLQHHFEIKIPAQFLHDVLGNLINNAIKYGKQGSHIKITDELTPYFYNIYIENIGYQIRKEEEKRIFEKGARGYVTKSVLKEKEEFQQSLSENKGLGLYLAKGIIKEGLNGNVVLHESISLQNTLFGKHTFAIKIPTEKIRKVR